jgi:hypothetical protein
MRRCAFPREPFEALGYNVAVHGQKTFNGVAGCRSYVLTKSRRTCLGMSKTITRVSLKLSSQQAG